MSLNAGGYLADVFEVCLRTMFRDVPHCNDSKKTEKREAVSEMDSTGEKVTRVRRDAGNLKTKDVNYVVAFVSN
jgi:hypothetical protein